VDQVKTGLQHMDYLKNKITLHLSEISHFLHTWSKSLLEFYIRLNMVTSWTWSSSSFKESKV